MAVRPQLVAAAARIARNNSEDWKRFFIALAAFAEEGRNNCVMSPIETLQVNQGKAQALTDLCEELDKCIEKDDRAIQRKEREL